MTAPTEPSGTLPFTGALFTLPVMLLGLILTIASALALAYRRTRGHA